MIIEHNPKVLHIPINETIDREGDNYELANKVFTTTW